MKGVAFSVRAAIRRQLDHLLHRDSEDAAEEDPTDDSWVDQGTDVAALCLRDIVGSDDDAKRGQPPVRERKQGQVQELEPVRVEKPIRADLERDEQEERNEQNSSVVENEGEAARELQTADSCCVSSDRVPHIEHSQRYEDEEFVFLGPGAHEAQPGVLDDAREHNERDCEGGEQAREESLRGQEGSFCHAQEDGA